MITNYNNQKEKYTQYTVDGFPVRHKRKVPFDPRISLSLDYRRMVREIREMDSRLEDMVLNEKDYLELVNDAYSSNIHWSVKLEGNDLPLKEVKKLTTEFTSGKKEESKSGPVQEILNHLYSYFVKKHFDLPWNVDTICSVHKILLKNTGAGFELGTFRTKQASVIGSDGMEYFIACPPGSIREEMISLLEWLNSSPYDEITTATLFFHEFESIHPFLDGNGRTGRTLFHVLLQELGLKNSNLCKFEQELLDPSTIYYTLLAYTDRTADYAPLIMYVTESLHNAYQKAVVTFGERDKLNELDEISKVLVKRSKKLPHFNLSDAGSWVTVSDQTIRNKLNELVDIGILEKEGRTKSQIFRFRDPFRNMKGILDNFDD